MAMAKLSAEELAKIDPKPSVKPDSSFKELLELYGSTSGFFGVAKAYSYYQRKRWVPFMLWCLITCVFLGITADLMAKLKSNFDSSPYTTKIQHLNQNSLPFPRVMICSDVSNSEVARLKYNLTEDQFNYLFVFHLDKAGKKANFTLEKQQNLASWYKQLARSPNFDLSKFLYTLIETPCEQFFVPPIMREMSIELNGVCGIQFFPLMSDKGFCQLLKFQISNANVTEPEDLSQVVPGLTGGLEFFPQKPKPFSYYLVYIGFPTVPIRETPVLVSQGQEVWISLNLKLTHRIQEFDNCTNDKRTKFFPEYRQTSCLYECLTLDFYDQCKCIMIGFNVSKPNGTRWCEPTDYFGCYRDYKNVQPFIFKPRLSKCNDKCKPPCLEYDYYIATTYRLIENGDVKIKVFHEHLSCEDIKNVNLLTLEGVLGSVGGVMGFWFGSSLLSVLHLLTWLAELLHFGLKTLWSKRTGEFDP